MCFSQLFVIFCRLIQFSSFSFARIFKWNNSPSSAFSYLSLDISVNFIALFLLAVIGVFVYAILRCKPLCGQGIPRVESKLDDLILGVLFIPIMRKCLQIFDCFTSTDKNLVTTTVLLYDPSLVCYSAFHSVCMTLSVCTILFVLSFGFYYVCNHKQRTTAIKFAAWEGELLFLVKVFFCGAAFALPSYSDVALGMMFALWFGVTVLHVALLPGIGLHTRVGNNIRSVTFVCVLWGFVCAAWSYALDDPNNLWPTYGYCAVILPLLGGSFLLSDLRVARVCASRSANQFVAELQVRF